VRFARYTAACCLLGAAVGVAFVNAPVWLLRAVLLGFLLRAMLWSGLGRAVRAALPVLVFAAALVFVQWVSRSPLTLLPLKVVAVFLFTTVAFRILPWASLASCARPGSLLQTLVLFALFVRHFAHIFTGEGLRMFRARALCISKPCGRGAFHSLVWALAAFFSRSIVRAERFYAAQWLRGWAE